MPPAEPLQGSTLAEALGLPSLAAGSVPVLNPVPVAVLVLYPVAPPGVHFPLTIEDPAAHGGLVSSAFLDRLEQPGATISASSRSVAKRQNGITASTAKFAKWEGGTQGLFGAKSTELEVRPGGTNVRSPHKILRC
jgi:hypothetical protein